MKRIAFLIAVFFAFFASPLAAQPQFPELSGRVVDEANIIPPDVEAQLTAKLEALETQSQRQLVVATIPDLQGYDISDYGYQLGREWGIGDAERNDGALLIVAPNDRKMRIEVGYGLEGTLTDAYSSLIIQNVIRPRFRDGDLAGGIVAGTDALITQLSLPPDEAARIAQQAGQQQRNSSREGGFPIGTLIWLGFMFFFFVLPLLRRGRRYRAKGKGPWGDRRGKRDWKDTAGDIILWEIGSAIARGAMSGGGRSGGSSWGGGGGFGGGGFSGGGGSFGGGGASGGW